MNNSLLNLILCGAFIFVPTITLIIGIRLITRFLGFKNKWSTLSVDLLIGLVFFEASSIGMLADPRSTSMGGLNIIKIAGLIGLGAFLIILVIGPVYTRILHLFKH